MPFPYPLFGGNFILHNFTKQRHMVFLIPVEIDRECEQKKNPLKCEQILIGIVCLSDLAQWMSLSN